MVQTSDLQMGIEYFYPNSEFIFSTLQQNEWAIAGSSGASPTPPTSLSVHATLAIAIYILVSRHNLTYNYFIVTNS